MIYTFLAFFARFAAPQGNDQHVFGVFRVPRCPGTQHTQKCLKMHLFSTAGYST